MKYDTSELEIMVNYLNRYRGYDIQMTQGQIIPGATEYEIGDLSVDDPLELRPDYDLTLAKFLDGYKDGDDLTQKKDFDALFVKGRLPESAKEGFARYDALFRDTLLHYSVFPEDEWEEMGKFRLSVCHLMDDTTTMRVLKAVYAEEDPIHGPHLYLRIKGGVWNSLPAEDEEASDRDETEYAENEALHGPSAVELDEMK